MGAFVFSTDVKENGLEITVWGNIAIVILNGGS